MKTNIIDGREMRSQAIAHAYLAEKLSFPDYYGGNLDALHDCLCDIPEETHLIVSHVSELLSALGSYGTALLHVLEYSAEENDFLTITFYDAESAEH